MSAQDFISVQHQLTAHLRDPHANPPLPGIEDRRLTIYRDLIYNNIEGFISGGFPILRSILSDSVWHGMVRDFIRSHQAHTPYFLEISQEFLTYLQNERQVESDPPFMLELAHYEWVELALDVSTEEFPSGLNHNADLLASHPIVSPLAWNLSYQFPVHLIGPDHQPTAPPESPTFLVVYRNKSDSVKFMESNAATSRLLSILAQDDAITGREALLTLANEMQAPDPQVVVNFGTELLQRLQSLDIICGCPSSNTD